jgi:hypothetical protein
VIDRYLAPDKRFAYRVEQRSETKLADGNATGQRLFFPPTVWRHDTEPLRDWRKSSVLLH